MNKNGNENKKKETGKKDRRKEGKPEKRKEGQQESRKEGKRKERKQKNVEFKDSGPCPLCNLFRVAKRAKPLHVQ